MKTNNLKIILGAALICVCACTESNEATPTVGERIGNAEAVDMGLSVCWASCNLGADSPEKVGGYYQQRIDSVLDGIENGEKYSMVKVKDFYGTGKRLDKAMRQLGATWRLPTEREFNELRKNCYVQTCTCKGVSGILFTSKYNGNSIFLPVTGENLWVNTPSGRKKKIVSNNTGHYRISRVYDEPQFGLLSEDSTYLHYRKKSMWCVTAAFTFGKPKGKPSYLSEGGFDILYMDELSVDRIPVRPVIE